MILNSDLRFLYYTTIQGESINHSWGFELIPLLIHVLIICISPSVLFSQSYDRHKLLLSLYHYSYHFEILMKK